MSKIFFLLMLVVGLYAEIIDGVAVTVKGDAITLYDIKNEMQLSHLSAKKATSLLIRKKLEEQEIKEKGIRVSPTEVYEEIKKSASRNNMSVPQFYDAVRNTNGLSSSELKTKVKYRLLSQKLHASIAYSHISQPTDDEIKEYFELHKDRFNHPSEFNVIIYQSTDKNRLAQKINNPMLNASDIVTSEKTLPYDRINPNIAKILSETPVGVFSPIMAGANNTFMSFYIKSVNNNVETKLESVKAQIANEIMDKKREQVLSDYFARLRHNADIQVIRMP